MIPNEAWLKNSSSPTFTGNASTYSILVNNFYHYFPKPLITICLVILLVTIRRKETKLFQERLDMQPIFQRVTNRFIHPSPVRLIKLPSLIVLQPILRLVFCGGVATHILAIPCEPIFFYEYFFTTLYRFVYSSIMFC